MTAEGKIHGNGKMLLCNYPHFKVVQWSDGLLLYLQESGCDLFAALCKEDLIYSQPMNHLTLNMPFLKFKP